MKYRRARQMAWRTLGDDTVLLHLQQKRMYGLNPAGARVWLALDAADGLDQLVAAAANGERSRVERDVARFVAELVALGLAEERRSDEREARPDGADGSESPPATGPAADAGADDDPEVPKVLWQEKAERIASTSVMFSSGSPIRDPAPAS